MKWLQKLASHANVCSICKVDCMSTEKCWLSAINSSCCCGVLLASLAALGSSGSEGCQRNQSCVQRPGELQVIVLPSLSPKDGIWTGTQAVPPPIPGATWEGWTAGQMSAVDYERLLQPCPLLHANHQSSFVPTVRYRAHEMRSALLWPFLIAVLIAALQQDWMTKYVKWLKSISLLQFLEKEEESHTNFYFIFRGF